MCASFSDTQLFFYRFAPICPNILIQQNIIVKLIDRILGENFHNKTARKLLHPKSVTPISLGQHNKLFEHVLCIAQFSLSQDSLNYQYCTNSFQIYNLYGVENQGWRFDTWKHMVPVLIYFYLLKNVFHETYFYLFILDTKMTGFHKTQHAHI